MYRIVSVRPLEEFHLEIAFDDGTKSNVDLSDLAGKGVFSLWLEPGEFGKVRIGESGELAWGDVDLCPDALYLRATGKRVEEVFPKVAQSPAHA